MKRRAVGAQLSSRGIAGPLAGDKAFQGAGEACAALAAHLGSRQYFGGERPSSLDAAAFPLLCFALHAPAVRLRAGAPLPQPPPHGAAHARPLRARESAACAGA